MAKSITKSRVKTKLKQKVSKKKSHNTSEDLDKLTEDYNLFCTRLQGLVKALMDQHAAMLASAKAKSQVAQQLALLSKDTVLYEMTGQMAGADRSAESVNSYLSIQEGVTNKNNMYAEKYKQFVVDYAQQWYKTVTDRVGAGLKKAEAFRLELDHYQAKVESLRQSANSTMAKGKQVDAKATEKLTRNEDKLIKIKETTTKLVNDLCLLMEEVTERSWRDLHPLLVKCSQFEVQVSGDESKALHSLNEVVSALKKVAADTGIKAQSRLEDLGKLEVHQLSTRSKDDSRNHLAIENGMAGLALGGGGDGSVYGGGSVYSSDNNSSYFPPGTTAAQGLGGFPVKVQSSTDVGSTHSRSTHSHTMSHMHAAPAPTLDTMAQAFGTGGAPTGSAPNSFGTPSIHSDFSGTPAPPPSSAPPPPPPATPGNPTNPFGASSPGPYGVPASGGPPAPSPYGGYNPLQSPMPTPNPYGSNAGGYPQQSPMPMQSPMPGANYAQQQTPMGGGFAQQRSPMGGSFSQQPSMYQSPPPQQQQQQYAHRASAPPSYGQNPFG